MLGNAVFSGVFELREGVSEEEFLPTLKTFFEHFIDQGFASEYLILKQAMSLIFSDTTSHGARCRWRGF
jgi:hypothetical protein